MAREIEIRHHRSRRALRKHREITRRSRPDNRHVQNCSRDAVDGTPPDPAIWTLSEPAPPASLQHWDTPTPNECLQFVPDSGPHTSPPSSKWRAAQPAHPLASAPTSNKWGEKQCHEVGSNRVPHDTPSDARCFRSLTHTEPTFLLDCGRWRLDAPLNERSALTPFATGFLSFLSARSKESSTPQIRHEPNRQRYCTRTGLLIRNDFGYCFQHVIQSPLSAPAGYSWPSPRSR